MARMPGVLTDTPAPGGTWVLKKAVFRLPCQCVPDARAVSLVGSFNRWDAHMHPMSKDPESGCWVTTVMLPPGVYPYLYDVDGGWHNDPEDDGRMPTGWGNEYSVKVVR